MEVIVIRDLHKEYGGTKLFNGLNLRLNEHEHLVVIGPNGAGKTTFVRILLGIERPSKGYVKIFGVTPSKARDSGLIAGILDNVFPPATRINDLIDLVNAVTSIDLTMFEKNLVELGLYNEIHKPIDSFSAGMKRKLLIALLLSLKVPVLVIDDPFSYLDPASAHKVEKLIVSNLEMHKLVVITMHKFKRRFAKHFRVMLFLYEGYHKIKRC